MAIREGTGAVPQIADTVYGNGTILTMNPAQPEAEAVAVAGGVIIDEGAVWRGIPLRRSARQDHATRLHRRAQPFHRQRGPDSMGQYQQQASWACGIH